MKRIPFAQRQTVTTLPLVLALLLTARSLCEEKDDASPLNISDGPQLFLDDVLVSRMTNVERELHRPRRHPSNPLIVQEFPWEKRTLQVYGTVLFDPQANRYRCWYLASRSPDEKPEYYMCYAESADGIRWRKPMIGPVRMPDLARHNIVVPGGHGLCVLLTLGDPDPRRRFKGLGGDTLAFSPDGITWSLEPFNAAGKNDTGSSVVFWKGEYLAYVRNQERDPNWRGVMRAVALSTSSGFRHWTPKKTILMSDKQDGYPWVQPYGLEVSAYGDQLVGLLPMLYLDRIEGNNSLGAIKVQLVVSRDGRRWHRVARRATFFAPGSGDAWDRGTIFPSTTLLVKGDQIYIYYTGVSRRHGEGKGAPKGIGLATLRRDGFVSLNASATPGTIVTRPLSFVGRTLFVNADVNKNGYVRAELRDASGKALQPYLLSRCRPVTNDNLNARITWDGKGTIDPPANGASRIAFELKHAKLYSFRIE
jgi:hypothetical protein